MASLPSTHFACRLVPPPEVLSCAPMKHLLLALVLACATGFLAAEAVRPALFAEGVISTTDFELNAAFLPDGKTVFFTKAAPDMTFWTIVSSRLTPTGWSEPEIAPFSGRYSDADLCVAPDGSRMAFISRRPVPGRLGPPVPHIWFVVRTADGWSEPRNAAALNSDAGEYYPSIAADGTMYFASARPGGLGRGDVYRSRPVSGEYGAPESAPRRLPNGINSPATEFCPSLSPDGRTLYFTSTRGRAEDALTAPRSYSELTARLRGIHNGLGNIYWVPMSAVREP